MKRFARALVSLVMAYAVVVALFVGSVAAGYAAASPQPLCVAASGKNSDSAPLPVSRDLACLVAGCCGSAASGLVPAASGGHAFRVSYRVSWHDLRHPVRIAPLSSAAFARAPPFST